MARQVRFDGRLGSVGELEDSVPAAAELLDLEQNGDSVETMMIRERLDDGVVLSGQAPCLGEQAVGAMRWNCLLVDLGHMVAG